MRAPDAIDALAALAQESRLALYRLLMKSEARGLPAGDIARKLGMPSASLSFHVKELRHAGLVVARRQGRFVYYRVNSARMGQVLEYLTENCCAGSMTGVIRNADAPSRQRAAKSA